MDRRIKITKIQYPILIVVLPLKAGFQIFENEFFTHAVLPELASNNI